MTQPPSRLPCFLRFSLRGLLLVVTALAISLGWYASRVQSQRSAVAAIRARGGAVWYDCEVNAAFFTDPQARPAEPRWLIDLLGPDWFHQVAVVDMNSSRGRGISDANLEPLTRLRGLKKVVLRDTREVTATGVQSLGRIPSLEWLYLNRPEVAAADLRPLRDLPRLSYLAISTPLGDAGLREFAQFPALSELELDSTGITDDGLRQLKSLPTLQRLKLLGVYRLLPELEQELRASHSKLAIDDGSFNDWRRNLRLP